MNMNRKSGARRFSKETLRVELAKVLAGDLDPSSTGYHMIVDGVWRLNEDDLIRMCREHKVLPALQPQQSKWPLEVRFIYEMRQFGMDLYAVLELLQDEFPEMSLSEIKCRIKPFRTLAWKWYSMGDKIVHGIIRGWIMAAMEK
jgi:hypothetical protein